MSLLKDKLRSPAVLSHTELSPEQMKHGQRLMVQEGSLWSFMNGLAGPASLVITAFALSLKADAFAIGLVSALPLVAALLQLWTPQLVVRMGSRRTVAVFTLGVARLLFLPLTMLAIAAWLWPSLYVVWLVVLLIFLTVYSALTAVGATAWISWAGTMVPTEQRAIYFARRNTIVGGFGLIVTFAAGGFLDWWKDPVLPTNQSNPVAYVILFFVAAVFGIITVYKLYITPDVASPVSRQAPRHRLRDGLSATWNHLPLRRFLIFRSAWLFAVGMVIPYYTVYLLQNLKLSFTEISVLTNIGALAGLLSTPLWGKVLEMYGCSRVIFWTSLVKIIYVVAWAFVVPGDPFLPLIALHISLVTDAGMTLAASNLLMNLMPAQDAGNVAYFSVFIAITSVVSAGAPFLAGLLIGFIGHSSFAIFGFGMGGIQLMFLASGVLRLLSMLLWGGFADKGIR